MTEDMYTMGHHGWNRIGSKINMLLHQEPLHLRGTPLLVWCVDMSRSVGQRPSPQIQC